MDERERSQKILDVMFEVLHLMVNLGDRTIVRVKAKTRILGCGVPDRAQPGDLVVGNRGAAARVMLDERTSVLYLEYDGNYSRPEGLWRHGRHIPESIT